MRDNRHGYSANVHIRLLVDGRSFDVGQLYGDTVILRDPIDHPPGPAELVLKIDESEHRWTVDLPQGLSRNVRTVELRNRQATASG